jgi:hypothetical protein
MVEAIDTFKIAPTSIANTFGGLHNLHMMLMCVWMSPYHISAALVGQSLGSYLKFWLPPEGQTTL